MHFFQKKDYGSQLLEIIDDHKNEQGIIYRSTRESVEDTTRFLNDHNIKSLSYHAGLTPNERKNNQEAFNKDKIDIIVATIAFGMGIDKSNIRFVIHCDICKNIEAYYQETGRAGRDGEISKCILLFSRGDMSKIKYFLDQMTDDIERQRAFEKFEKMIRYATHNSCRRKQLLKYFGEEYLIKNCKACDICLGDANKIDITTDARMIMSAILRTGQYFGGGHIIDIVYGAKTKRIKELGHHRIKTYGVGQDKNKNHWRFIIDELLAIDALLQEGDKYPVLKISDSGLDILYGKKQVSALKIESKEIKKIKSDKIQDDELFDKDLFEKLRFKRKDLAEKQNIAPFIIFSDKTLKEMCCYYPTNKFEMSKINGVGDVKLKHYGDEFINIINKYIDENPQINVLKIIPDNESQIQNIKPRKVEKSKTLEETYNLFIKGHSVKEIAKIRNLVHSTIAGHIERLIEENRNIDIDNLVEPLKRQKIEEYFNSSDAWSLTNVVENFNGEVSYDEARFVRGYIKQKGIV